MAADTTNQKVREQACGNKETYQTEQSRGLALQLASSHRHAPAVCTKPGLPHVQVL
jgi:hypothetical protein